MSRHKHELEFLPATLEIQDTPASPLGRAVSWTVMALFVVAVLWAMFSQIDIVAVAQGKIVPSARVKLVQPLEIGTVRAIHVQDGQTVKVGDVLIEIDPTASTADQSRLSHDLRIAQLDVARVKALEKMASGERVDTLAMHHADPSDAALAQVQQRLLEHEWQEYSARLSAADEALATRTAEKAVAIKTVEKFEATLPIITQRTDALQRMVDKQYVPQQQFLELEQQRVEMQKGLAAEQQHVIQLQAAIAQAAQERLALQAEFKRTLLQRLTESEQKVAALEQELAKVNQRRDLQRLTAPVNGVVQQLAVHTVGGVVTPAQELMRIVPLQDHLEIEALVQNKDIGFVSANQEAMIKVDAFPFTRYGTLDGSLRSVSYDAIADEKLGLVYAARVALDKAVIQVNDKLVNLTPGMAVTVEIKTGTRTLMEYVLSPVMQYAQESARER